MLDAAKWEQKIQQLMETAQVPGLALAILQDGVLAYAKGFGVTSTDAGGAPVTADTLFRIGSVTKPFTAAIVLRLAETGQLALDTPVREYLPWLTFSDPAASEQVTLRHLLSHTSGLATAADAYGARDPEGLERWARTQLPAIPLVAPPGKLWNYSNPGYNLAGLVAQSVSGKPFAQLMQELLLDPLSMRRSTLDPLVALTYPLALGHIKTPDGTVVPDRIHPENTADYPSGFLLASVSDLARFAAMLLSEGQCEGQSVLSPQSVQAMRTPQAPLYTPNGTSYGLGLMCDTYKGVKVAGHGGGIPHYLAHFGLVPGRGVALIAVWNRMADEVHQLWGELLGELLGLPEQAPAPEPIPPDRARWPRCTGAYLSRGRGLMLVRQEDEQLVAEFNGAAAPLTAVGVHTYLALLDGGKAAVPVGFVPEADGPTRYLMLAGAPAERFEPDFTLPSAEAAAGLAGRYEPEQAWMGAYNVRADGPILWVQAEARGEREVACIAISPGRFACEFGLLEFREPETLLIAGRFPARKRQQMR